MSKKKTQRKPDGALRVEGIHLTFSSNDGKVIKEYVAEPTFFLLDDDSEATLAKKAAELLILHAERIKRDEQNWRTTNV